MQIYNKIFPRKIQDVKDFSNLFAQLFTDINLCGDNYIMHMENLR